MMAAKWRVIEENTGYIKVMDWRGGDPQKPTASKCTVCTLTYRELQDGSYEWEFAPWWDRIMSVSEHWKPVVLDGWIPGLDPDDFDNPAERKRDTYVFKHRKPPFVYQRTPPRNRPDAMEMMEELGIEGYDAMEFMIRTPLRCGNDCRIVERTPDDDYDGA